MKNPLVRKLLAILAGVLAGGAAVGLIEVVGHLIFPPPAGVDLLDPDVLATLMDQIPLGAKIAVTVAWIVGSLVGGWVAVKVARRLDAEGTLMLALVVGAVLLAFGAYSLVTIPHPIWMTALGILAPLPSAWLGARFAGAGTASGQATTAG